MGGLITIEIFIKKLELQLQKIFSDWNLSIKDNKGIDYCIPYDSKIISALLEVAVFKEVEKIAQLYNIELTVPEVQNKYPDFSILFNETNQLIALDVKSSYRVSNEAISGFTLGSYQGALRDKDSIRYSTMPYKNYLKHFCICIIYDKSEQKLGLPIDNINVFIREKYSISNDKPGSGNTKNIGSIKKIEDIKSGNGIFTPYGELVYEDYWRNYEKYKNISEYLKENTYI